MVCEKVKYETYKDAIDAIVGISKRDKKRMSAYKCFDCGGYHLTTVRKTVLQPTKKERYSFDLDKIPRPVTPNKYPKARKINTSVKLEPQRLLSRHQAQILKTKIDMSAKTDT